MDTGQSRRRPGRTDGGDYRLGIRDFGPIEHADVEFRPLTVFVGPGNTGKSYLATLIYALHRYFAVEGDPCRWESRRLVPGQRALDRWPDGTLASELPSELASWTSAVAEHDDMPRLPGSVVEAVRSEVERADRVNDPLRAEIVRSFGAESIAELVRRSGSDAAEVAVVPSEPVEMGLLGYRIRMEGDRFDVEGSASDSIDPLAATARSPDAQRWTQFLRREARRCQVLESDGSAEDRLRALHLNRIFHQLADAVRRPLIAPLRRLAYYLPADRTGIMHSHKMVVAALVQSAARAGLRQTPSVPTLSGVLTDFLEELIHMGDSNGPSPARPIRRPVASRLEDAVLGGKVRVESSDSDYPQFLYRPEGWRSDLALMRSSSMVSELAPLVLYLRHVVGRGDVLIIEEPESHLHPAMQVEVIGRIARIVRAGLRVIVTTHSEWVLDALANIVNASRVAEPAGPTGDREPVLRPHEVGVWRFKSGKAGDGVAVEEIEIDDEGMYPSGFDQVAVDLHNRWAELEDHPYSDDADHRFTTTTPITLG